MIEFLTEVLDFIRHLDDHIQALVTEYKTATYFILALIIFCETGLVITPFLPGDSLLFAAGAVTAGSDVLSIWLLIPLLIGAAILGDNVNYFFGRYLGKRVYQRDYWFFKREYLDKTQAFYAKYGGRTLIMARFVPIVRTFAPFVAGVGKMDYKKFITYCISGAVLWVTSMTMAGYFLGKIPWIQENFELVVIGIIGVSVLPMLIEVLRARRQAA
jgi:membrane-associated protein